MYLHIVLQRGGVRWENGGEDSKGSFLWPTNKSLGFVLNV